MSIRTLPPLIFIPGLMASQLWDNREKNKRIWPIWHHDESGKLTGLSIKELIETENREPCGLFPDAYSELIHFFWSLGYVENQNLWIFAYDWMQSNVESSRKLARLIDKEIGPNAGPIHVIGHSMGGIVAKAAREIHGAPIARIAFIGTPHFGTPRAYFAIHPGIDFSFISGFYPKLFSGMLWNAIMKRVEESLPLTESMKLAAACSESVYELLPDRSYPLEQFPLIHVCDNGRGPKPMSDLDEIYFKDGFTRFPDAIQKRKVEAALAFKERINAKKYPDDLYLYSGSEETPDSITYQIEHEMSLSQYLTSSGVARNWSTPQCSGQMGDGTVPAVSGAGGHPEAIEICGSHMAIPNCSIVHEFLKSFLCRQAAHALS